LLASTRFQRAANAGARAQRLLWASTGTKDPKASDSLYVKALAARLQDEGASSFVKSWNDLMACIDSKSVAIRNAS
jgi:transaldolase